MSAELQPKSTNRFQARLVSLKTNIRLFRDVLSESESLFDNAEKCVERIERLWVKVVCLILTVIGAITLIGWKIDLPYLVHSALNLFSHR